MTKDKVGQAPSGAEGEAADMTHGLLQAQVRMMDAVLRQNIEAPEFLKARFEKDRAMLTNLAGAPDAMAASTVLGDFWQGIASDYMAEAGRLGSLMAANAQQLGEGIADEATILAGGKPKP
jgi:hypothetical protein